MNTTAADFLAIRRTADTFRAMTPWLFTLTLESRPAGDTAFSVTPAKECACLSDCEGAKWSSFYDTWVRKETRNEGEARYAELELGMERAIEKVLCVKLDGTPIPGCLPEPVALDRKTKKLLFGPRLAGSALLAVGILESGLREDVQMGRGFARACPKGGPTSIAGVCGESDDGGRGRGPGGEACVEQIHPSVVAQFVDGDPVMKARAMAGDKLAREALAQSLLGRDPENIARCFRTALRMLLRANGHCGWWLATSKMHEDWDYAMFSMYGTGVSCVSANNGKTIKRVELFRKLNFRAKALIRAEAVKL